MLVLVKDGRSVAINAGGLEIGKARSPKIPINGFPDKLVLVRTDGSPTSREL